MIVIIQVYCLAIDHPTAYTYSYASFIMIRNMLKLNLLIKVWSIYLEHNLKCIEADELASLSLCCTPFVHTCTCMHIIMCCHS